MRTGYEVFGLQVVTRTQRHFHGTFTCFDHFANVLLFDAVEKLQEGGKGRERTLNQIIVPLGLVQSAEVLVRPAAAQSACFYRVGIAAGAAAVAVPDAQRVPHVTLQAELGSVISALSGHACSQTLSADAC